MQKEPFFKRIYLEITNVCNQECPFCPKTTRSPRFLSLEQFCHLTDKIQGHTEHLYFHVLGEPLLHPKLGIFLDEAHKRGLFVNLVTNGSLIAETGEMLLSKASLRQINFSLHSLSHLGITETTARLSKILPFIDVASRNKIYCSLRLWTGGIEENRPVLDSLSKYFALSYDLATMLASVAGRGIKLAERVFLNPADEFIWPSLQAPRQGNPAFCHGLKQQMAILVDGQVVPCCLDGEGVMNLGNLFEMNLKDIWKTRRAQDILHGFTEGKAVEELCQRCEYRTRFTR